MFVTRWNYLPTLAGYLDYVDLLKEWAAARQAAGQRMGLFRDSAPAEGFRLQTASYYEKLSALDTVRDKPASDTTVRDWINKTAPITRTIWQMEMFEITVPMPTLPGPGQYSVRLRGYPDPARGSVEDAARRLQANGLNVGAAEQRFARGEAVSELDFTIDRMGDWEELSEKIFTGSDIDAGGINLSNVFKKRSSLDLWENLVAAPPAKS